MQLSENISMQATLPVITQKTTNISSIPYQTFAPLSRAPRGNSVAIPRILLINACRFYLRIPKQKEDFQPLERGSLRRMNLENGNALSLKNAFIT